MIGFHHLSLNVENSIIASYYNHSNKSIFESLHFFMKNPFYTNFDKNKILNNFCRVQKTRYLILSAIKKYRIRRYSINKEDLLLMPLSDYKESHKIYIWEINKIYTFYIPFLLKFWNNNIYNSDYMIICPKIFKNPYTNKIFNKNTLYYIYLKAFLEMIPIPISITQYFNSKFNKSLFLDKFGTLLQEEAIYSYVSTNDIELFNDIINIKNMFPDITNNIGTNITDFSDQEYLIKEMNNILLLYYLFIYSGNYYKKEKSRQKLIIELNLFNSLD